MNIFNKIKFKGDIGIWWIMIGLSLVSIVAVYSSSAGVGSPWFYLGKQVLGIAVGLALAYLTSYIPSSVLRGSAPIILLISIVLMILLLKYGTLKNDARRELWHFRPVEFVKIGLLIFTARMLEIYQTLTKNKRNYCLVLAPVIVVCVLIFFSSASASLILAASCFTMMCVAGVRRRHLLVTAVTASGLLVTAVVVTAFVLNYNTAVYGAKDQREGLKSMTLKMETNIRKVRRLPTAAGRFGLLTKPKNSIVSDSKTNQQQKNTQKYKKYEQADYARLAIASSGPIGKGVGQSTFRYHLREPFSDFIFAIIIEEWGIIPTILLVMFPFFFLLPFRVGVIINKSTTYFPTFLVIGITMQITLQALVHMGVSTGLFVVTGQNLPLVSQGFSNVCSTCIMLGILLSISREVRTKSQAQVESISIENASNI
ncbi:cell division protein FtsW [Bacteroidia bacterium]|nr:cell division protein FtsW [Bacteroidia bacterium]